MTYEVHDNYGSDSDATYDIIFDIIVDHLEDLDLYGLKGGVDFSKHDVANEMVKYEWGYIDELRSVDRWMQESGL